MTELRSREEWKALVVSAQNGEPAAGLADLIVAESRALAEEVERLREALASRTSERDGAVDIAIGNAAERDEALARVAAGLAELDRSFSQSAVSNDPHRAHRDAVAYVKRDVRRALTEVQAGAGASGAGDDRG